MKQVYLLIIYGLILITLIICFTFLSIDLTNGKNKGDNIVILITNEIDFDDIITYNVVENLKYQRFLTRSYENLNKDTSSLVSTFLTGRLTRTNHSLIDPITNQHSESLVDYARKKKKKIGIISSSYYYEEGISSLYSSYTTFNLSTITNGLLNIEPDFLVCSIDELLRNNPIFRDKYHILTNLKTKENYKKNIYLSTSIPYSQEIYTNIRKELGKNSIFIYYINDFNKYKQNNDFISYYAMLKILEDLILNMIDKRHSFILTNLYHNINFWPNTYRSLNYKQFNSTLHSVLNAIDSTNCRSSLHSMMKKYFGIFLMKMETIDFCNDLDNLYENVVNASVKYMDMKYMVYNDKYGFYITNINFVESIKRIDEFDINIRSFLK